MTESSASGRSPLQNLCSVEMFDFFLQRNLIRAILSSKQKGSAFKAGGSIVLKFILFVYIFFVCLFVCLFDVLSYPVPSLLSPAFLYFFQVHCLCSGPFPGDRPRLSNKSCQKKRKIEFGNRRFRVKARAEARIHGCKRLAPSDDSIFALRSALDPGRPLAGDFRRPASASEGPVSGA